MGDRPIIFSAAMVRALIEGRKTQTRRIPRLLKGCWIEEGQVWAMTPDGPDTLPLPYAPGDRLYVREAWRSERGLDQQNAAEIEAACLDAGYSRVWAPIFYEVDAERVNFENGMVAGRYRHGRFMPRWASRLTLTVTDVRLQRLQEISEADARAEGIDHNWPRIGKDAFRDLWNSLHGAEAWDANPWVAALTFTVQRGNIDKIGVASR